MRRGAQVNRLATLAHRGSAHGPLRAGAGAARALRSPVVTRECACNEKSHDDKDRDKPEEERASETIGDCFIEGC